MWFIPYEGFESTLDFFLFFVKKKKKYRCRFTLSKQKCRPVGEADDEEGCVRVGPWGVGNLCPFLSVWL